MYACRHDFVASDTHVVLSDNLVRNVTAPRGICQPVIHIIVFDGVVERGAVEITYGLSKSDLHEPFGSSGSLYKVLKCGPSEQVFSRQTGSDAHATVWCASARLDQTTGVFPVSLRPGLRPSISPAGV